MACERPGSTVPLVLVPWELVMPTYEYACIECGHHVEVVQSMSDAPLTECGTCGGRLRKVFSPIVTGLVKAWPSTTNWMALAVLLHWSVCQELSARSGPAVSTALPADPLKKQLATPIVRSFLATISSL